MNRRLLYPLIACFAVGLFAASPIVGEEKDTYLTKDGKLKHALVIKDAQGGFAGFSGHIWTIEPDGSWQSAPFLNKNVRKADQKGKLDAEQMGKLAAELKRQSLLKLPKRFGAKTLTNPHVFTVTFGKAETSFVLQAGKPLPEIDDKAAAEDEVNRFVSIVRLAQGMMKAKDAAKKP